MKKRNSILKKTRQVLFFEGLEKRLKLFGAYTKLKVKQQQPNPSFFILMQINYEKSLTFKMGKVGQKTPN